MMQCDPSSAFFGFMGVTSALVFANLGAVPRISQFGVSGSKQEGAERRRAGVTGAVQSLLARVLRM